MVEHNFTLEKTSGSADGSSALILFFHSNCQFNVRGLTNLSGNVVESTILANKIAPETMDGWQIDGKEGTSWDAGKLFGFQGGVSIKGVISAGSITASSEHEKDSTPSQITYKANFSVLKKSAAFQPRFDLGPLSVEDALKIGHDINTDIATSFTFIPWCKYTYKEDVERKISFVPKESGV